jgi:hypothetical protein
MTKVWILLLIQLAIIPGLVLLLRKLKLLNFASLLILSIYCITLPISGIAHFLTEATPFRGYFDLLPYSQTWLPFETALLSLIVEICLVIGILLSSRVIDSKQGLRVSNFRLNRLQVIILISVLPLSVYALTNISQFLERNNINRVLFLQGGLARYYFVAIWMIWPLVVFSLYLLNSNRVRENSARQLVLLCLTGTLFFSSLSWTGSRLLPLMFFTLLILNAPRLSKETRRIIGLSAPIALGIYIYTTTLSRVGNFGYGKSSFSVGGFLDWQVGRFSILGATLKYNSDEGILQESTLAGSFAESVSGVARLLGITVFDDNGSYLSVSQQFGVVVFSDSNNRYLAPGLIIEMFRNFGLVGLVIFCLTVPVICNWLYTKSRIRRNTLSGLLFGYFTIAFVFVVFLSSSESLIAYFFYFPTPIIILILLNNAEQRRSIGNE